jgi:hypothetical protein
MCWIHLLVLIDFWLILWGFLYIMSYANSKNLTSNFLIWMFFIFLSWMISLNSVEKKLVIVEIFVLFLILQRKPSAFPHSI